MSKCYTKAMVAGRKNLGISVTLHANPRIIRSGPPAVGSCFFDEADRLIFITSNPAVRYFHWRRVLTSGRLSEKEYGGPWNWGEGNRGMHGDT